MSALRTGGRGGRQTARTTTTDDLGEYRLYGLSPSEYLVEATPQLPVGNGPEADAANAEHDGYTTTFFPGVMDGKEARTNHTRHRADRRGRVVHDPADTHGACQRNVTDSKGRPFSGMLMVMRMSNGNMSGNGWPIRPDGTFVLANVAPGQIHARGVAVRRRRARSGDAAAYRCRAGYQPSFVS